MECSPDVPHTCREFYPVLRILDIRSGSSENEIAGPAGTGYFCFGSGGALCTLARSPEPVAILEVPLLGTWT